MFVYRAEKSGYGPFQASIKGVSNNIFMNDFSYKHTPMYRGFLKCKTKCNYYDIYYGCESYEDLAKWFNFDLLIEYGFSINTYKVGDGYYEIGNSQVIFVKKQSKLILEVRPEDLPFNQLRDSRIYGTMSHDNRVVLGIS